MPCVVCVVCVCRVCVVCVRYAGLLEKLEIEYGHACPPDAQLAIQYRDQGTPAAPRMHAPPDACTTWDNRTDGKRRLRLTLLLAFLFVSWPVLVVLLGDGVGEWQRGT
jgi:hypothetical protein